MKPRRPVLGSLLLLLTFLFTSRSHALTNNLALTPPMGWNDWNSFFCNITEADIMNFADSIATNGMKAVGYQYINVDDCWQVSRGSNGTIVADPVKFPHGIAWLADYVHSRGLKFGIYSSHGTATCQGKPGGYGYEYLDAMTYASWGVDYLKYDSCNVPPGATALVNYSRMSDALLKCGRPIVFSICGGNSQSNPGYESWSPVLGNLWRTTVDIQPTYADLITHLDPNSRTAFVSGPGHWNDPDMMEVGRLAMTGTANQVEFTMWCIMAAPLIMGNNFINMTAQAKAILTNPEAIAVDQDPSGEQGVKVVNNINPIGTNEVWSKSLGYDFSTKAVALFNRLGPATNITCYWTNLGLQEGTATVRDLWAHADLGTFTNSFTAAVGSTNVVMLKIVGAPPALPVMGTNYLNDLQSVYAYTGSGTIIRDKSIGGHAIKIGGVTYSKGIGVNAFSGLEYSLGGIASRFQATIGVDDEVVGTGAASVIFQVYADGTLIYDSGVMYSNTPAQALDLDVTGVSRLVLGVNDADDNLNNDHADWANALVIVTNSTPMPPYAPIGLTANPGDQINLAWNAALSATNYNVKRALNSGGPYTNVASSLITIWTDSNVVSGTTYYYVVSAASSLGESSNSLQAAVTSCALPAVPANVTATVTSSNITVSWSPSVLASSYSVSRFTPGTPPTNIMSGITDTFFYDTTATAPTNYYYLVKADNGCNQSAFSTFVSATVSQPGMPPIITTQPASQTNYVGQSATFSVSATNTPLSYQWRSGAVGLGAYTNLTSGGQFSAVTNATLYITNLTLANAADFVVVVTNVNGAITSTAARLTVLTAPTNSSTSSYQQTILTDNPVSYWPLNETSGTLIHDVIGTNNGTAINPGGLTLGGPGILYGQGVTTDTAIYFTNTSSAYIKIPYSATLNTPRFTIETWLNMPVFPATGAGVDMNPLSFDDSNPKGWTFEIPSPNGANPKMYGWLGSNNSWTQINSGTCIQGQWSYYALTYDGTTFTMYTNGVIAGSLASGYTQVSSLHSLYLGAYDSGGAVTRFYRGGMEKVAFYTNGLPPARIFAHWQAGTNPIPALPVMSIQQTGANVAVSWTSGFLQKAVSVKGPWMYITNVASPYTIGTTNPARYFRATLQSPP